MGEARRVTSISNADEMISPPKWTCGMCWVNDKKYLVFKKWKIHWDKLLFKLCCLVPNQRFHFKMLGSNLVFERHCVLYWRDAKGKLCEENVEILYFCANILKNLPGQIYNIVPNVLIPICQYFWAQCGPMAPISLPPTPKFCKAWNLCSMVS